MNETDRLNSVKQFLPLPDSPILIELPLLPSFTPASSPILMGLTALLLSVLAELALFYSLK